MAGSPGSIILREGRQIRWCLCHHCFCGPSVRPEASVEGQPLSTSFGGRAAPGPPDRPCSSGAALATRWGEWVVSVQKEFEVLLSKDPKASSKLFFKIIKHRGPLGGAAPTWPRVPAGDEWRHFHLTTTKPLTPLSSLQSFQGSQGRAYLFNSVVNVGCGPAEERVLLTGLHAVADIYCENCKTTLGWKYEHAFESSQKYKEGKFIIELAHMIKDNGWE
ncbi:protein yippee-like 1 [Physeter macrocephalus]|uniref:Protein yippee-like 1 n=3 Tax=Amniota TaxID=32524 RepID=A0A9W2WBQ5_PHYMC|nr:protein yippee-like 1 [Physeter catodon]